MAVRKRQAQGKKQVTKKQYTKKSNVTRRAKRQVVNVNSGTGGFLAPALGTLGGVVGNALMPGVGGVAGSALGSLAGNAIKYLTGFGDYQIHENVLLENGPPKMVNPSIRGGTVIRHREYIKDIITSPTIGAFQNSLFVINPANENTFPYLHQIAMNYEQYNIEGMIFEYRSMSADALNSTNTALGSVIMATNYDTIDPPFRNKSEMENYEFGMSCKPSVNMMHPIECETRQSVLTELYTLNGALPNGADPRFYNLGNFQIATVGFQAAQVNIGELWVSYQVRLLKPRLYVSLGLDIGMASFRNSTYTNALPLGSGTLTTFVDNIGIIMDPPNRNIGFPVLGVRKHYEITMRWVGTSALCNVPLLTFTSATQTVYTRIPGLIAPGPGENSTCVVDSFSFITNANEFPVVTFGAVGVLPSAGTQLDIRINELNPYHY